LFENAQKTQSYAFILELASCLKAETKTHKEGSIAQRKAGDLLVNIYRWSDAEPKFKEDPKIQEIRKQVFPESEKETYDSLLANYLKRRAEKAQQNKVICCSIL